MRRGFVSKAPRPKMHTNPDAALLISEKIDIMISTADRAELILRCRFQSAHRLQLPDRIIKQLVLHTCLAFAANAKGNVAHHVVHDLVDLRFDLLLLSFRTHRTSALSDVESDSA